MLRIEEKEDDFSEILVGLGKQTAKECKDIEQDRGLYHARLGETCINFTRHTS